jgi:hypothetical protein
MWLKSEFLCMKFLFLFTGKVNPIQHVRRRGIFVSILNHFFGHSREVKTLSFERWKFSSEDDEETFYFEFWFCDPQFQSTQYIFGRHYPNLLSFHHCSKFIFSLFRIWNHKHKLSQNTKWVFSAITQNIHDSCYVTDQWFVLYLIWCCWWCSDEEVVEEKHEE